MLSVASNIKDTKEQLRRIPVRSLYDAIRNPRESTLALLRQLSAVRQMSPSQYALLKQQLPYFVCAMFNPSFRRSENFAYTEYFIVDIDHVSEKGLLMPEVRKAMAADTRVMLCFLSPSGDGLKVMFRLSERCHDAGLYKTFYKLFLTRFSHQYGLEQVVDTKTCDVTRACFLSADADAYLNPDAEPVVLADYVNPEENVNMAFDLKREAEKAERKEGAHVQPSHSEPDKDIMARIKATLNPHPSSQRPPAYVPAILNDIIGDLQKYVEDKGIVISEIVNIQYGKKLRCKIGQRQAEINLFYGKRGFSVVQSPRTGTDPEANGLMAEVIQCFLAEMI